MGLPGQRRVEAAKGGAYRNLLRLTLPVRDELGITATIHDIQRTFAQELQNADASDGQIAALLGQKTTRLVGRYTKHEMARLTVVAERAAGSHDAVMIHSACPAPSPLIGESASYETECPLASDSAESAEGPSLQGISMERVMGIEPTIFSLGS